VTHTRALLDGAARTAVGAVLLVAPGRLLRATAREPVSAAAVLLLGTVGIRDLALGAGTVAAAVGGTAGEARRWLRVGLASDSADAALSMAARRRIGTVESVAATGAALVFAAMDRWALAGTPAG
jgi:hypothetical protein